MKKENINLVTRRSSRDVCIASESEKAKNYENDPVCYFNESDATISILTQKVHDVEAQISAIKHQISLTNIKTKQ